MKKYHLIYVLALATTASLSLNTQAELVPMNEQSLSKTTAQAGITLSGQVDIAEGSISYTNEAAEQVGAQENWLVVNNISGKVEFKNAMIDLENSYGPNNKAAIKITLPETVEFKELKVGGLYLGPSSQKSSDHRYLLGVRINGKLNMPTQPKAYMFVKP